MKITIEITHPDIESANALNNPAEAALRRRFPAARIAYVDREIVWLEIGSKTFKGATPSELIEYLNRWFKDGTGAEASFEVEIARRGDKKLLNEFMREI